MPTGIGRKGSLADPRNSPLEGRPSRHEIRVNCTLIDRFRQPDRAEGNTLPPKHEAFSAPEKGELVFEHSMKNPPLHRHFAQRSTRVDLGASPLGARERPITENKARLRHGREMTGFGKV